MYLGAQTAAKLQPPVLIIVSKYGIFPTSKPQSGSDKSNPPYYLLLQIRLRTVCPRCGHAQSIPAAPAEPKADYRALLEQSIAEGAREEVKVFSCATCGAGTRLPGDVISTTCPFCGNPAVAGGSSRIFRPAGVLPFRLDEKQVRAALGEWESRLWFKPARLFQDAAGLKLAPVFLPYWSFDWDVTTDYKGARGTEVNKDTRWDPVTGTVRTKFDAATVFASKSVPRAEGNDLEPWDTEGVVAYKEEYLQGVHAETSSIEVREAGDIAHRLLQEQINYDVRRDIGGDKQRVDETDTHYTALSAQLLLLPVWVSRYTFRGRTYRVWINGRTGEVIGERPWSRTRALGAVIAPIAIAVAFAIALTSHRPLSDAAWQSLVIYFWGAITGQSIGFMIWSAGIGRNAPRRHRQFYVSRPAPGRFQQVDPAEMWNGTLQDDPESRAALVRTLGFAGLFLSLFPCLGTTMSLGKTGMMFAFYMTHAFSALAVIAFSWATWASFRQKRRILGTDGKS